MLAVAVAGVTLVLSPAADAKDGTIMVDRDRYQRLIAEAFAPVWLQEISEDQGALPGAGGSPLPLQDQMVRVDTFNLWKVSGNYERARQALREPVWHSPVGTPDLTPTTYYGVVESEEHAFIYYAYYHLSDGEGRRAAVDKRHEHDLEGVMLVVSKGSGLPPEGWKLLGAIVQRHNLFEVRSAARGALVGYAHGSDCAPSAMRPDCLVKLSPAKTGHLLVGSQAGNRSLDKACAGGHSPPPSGRPVRPSQEQFVCADDGLSGQIRPSFLPASGHGAVFGFALDPDSVVLAYDELSLGNQLWALLAAGQDARTAHYRLRSIDELWSIRGADPFDGFNDDKIGTRFKGNLGIGKSSAHPPWFWTGKRSGQSRGKKTSWLGGRVGDWFLDVLGATSGLGYERCAGKTDDPWICKLNEQLPPELVVGDTKYVCNKYLRENGRRLMLDPEASNPAPLATPDFSRDACAPGVEISTSNVVEVLPPGTRPYLFTRPSHDASQRATIANSRSKWVPNTSPCPKERDPWVIKPGDYWERVSFCAYGTVRRWSEIQSYSPNLSQGRPLSPLNLPVGATVWIAPDLRKRDE